MYLLQQALGLELTDCLSLSPFPLSRIMFGSNNLYVFYHPKELQALLKTGKKATNITYDFAQEELAANSGFDMSTEGKTKDDIMLREDLLTLMPMLHEANAMSEELNKKASNNLSLVNPSTKNE